MERIPSESEPSMFQQIGYYVMRECPLRDYRDPGQLSWRLGKAGADVNDPFDAQKDHKPLDLPPIYTEYPILYPGETEYYSSGRTCPWQ